MSSSPSHPIVTLTTDFGLTDHYVGTMKGVILKRCPSASVVDVCHLVPAFSILEGAYTIAQACRYYPPGAIHVVVIDPGVGSERRAILAEAGSQTFIAPDNGVLSLVFHQTPPVVVYEISNAALFEATVSSTFHGRDIFAAVAGSVACGKAKPEEMGRQMPTWVTLPGLQPIRHGEAEFSGMVLSVDQFGNIITNLGVEQFAGVQFRPFRLQAGLEHIDQFHRTFALARKGECFLYFGSSNYLEIAANQGRADTKLNVKAGDQVTLRLP